MIPKITVHVVAMPDSPRPNIGERTPASEVGAGGRTVVVREPEHGPRGDPCDRCGLPASRHRRRPGREKRRRETKRLLDLSRPIVSIDGEGKDLPCRRCGSDERLAGECAAGDGPCERRHVYTFLAAVDETGREVGSISNAHGLDSIQVLEFLCSLADAGEKRVFGFSLGYDLTMWLVDLPDDKIYRLMRPDARARTLPDGRKIRRRVRWHGFEIDYLRRRIDVCRARWDGQKMVRKSKITIWDVFGFYQTSFVKTMKLWKTAPENEICEIERMKRERNAFAHLTPREIEEYCKNECKLMSRLVRQLIDAHEIAGLPLRSFYGAGSTASALLDKMGTKEMKGPRLEEDLQAGVERAFFGGRFECSIVGPAEGILYNLDVSNAYPYQATFLPCLACGTWRRWRGRDADRAAREARLAVVRCRVRRSGPASWGPLPWRAPDGAITWPLSLGETWCWRDEYLAARDTLWPGVEAIEAWCYDTPCVHSPFALLPEVYRERCRIGKEGAGIVLKLGPNSVYGKTAQSRGGDPPYRSMVWAGCITSGCRAQILRAVAAHTDPADVLMVATDGILSREAPTLEEPRDTGTWDCKTDGVTKPLGGWERKNIPGGVFIARPGIYWPLKEGAEDKVKARGISRSVLGGFTCPDHRATVKDRPGTCETCGRELDRQSVLIERHFSERGWRYPYLIEGCVRFVGATAGVREGEVGPTRDEQYGRWIPYPIEVSFKPDPKRAAVNRDLTLDPWIRMPGPSSPYDPEKRCPEGEAMRRLEKMLEEQPDGEYVWQ